MANIIDGKLVSASVRASVKAEVEKLKEEGINPSLAVILVGNDPASAVYVKNKQKACIETGINPIQITMPEDTDEKTLLDKIDELNADDSVHGILVQLPLPKHLNETEVLLKIRSEKDVDAFHPYNVGKIMIGNHDLLPCTPAGVMVLLEKSGIDVSGKRCVVIGRSNIVGKPMAMLLLHANGTVTICHSRTQNLKEVCRDADILVASIGKPEFVKGDMVKEGAVVVDVGINRLESGKLVGDVDFAEVEPKASYITPVPGGVGPMTITMLLKNTLTAASIARGER